MDHDRRWLADTVRIPPYSPPIKAAGILCTDTSALRAEMLAPRALRHPRLAEKVDCAAGAGRRSAGPACVETSDV